MSPDRKVRETTLEARGAVSKSPGPRKVDEGATAHASPARSLQSSLAESLDTSPQDEAERWPGVVRMAIICGGSVVTWTGIVAICKVVLRA